ncbi:hypothetical protein AA309_31100 [Microvirga vignae]|uniref:Uncharacterized protein n=1 Tax=Microvirga vignae TaxID=1225564 RepID=A0A0H1R3V6_9HYPH|nr:hypothetical protein AA309_31100 [Microvirga vignae]
MSVVISACTNKACSYGLMPLARLKLRPPDAVNDNAAQLQVRLGIDPSKRPGSSVAFHTRRAAFGRAELIIALLVLVTGIVALPLLQAVTIPIMTASEQGPEVLRGSPIAPALLAPQRRKGTGEEVYMTRQHLALKQSR